MESMPPQQATPAKKNKEKAGGVAFTLSVLFHAGILLLIGGIVLIPAVVQKTAFDGDPSLINTHQEPLLDEPPMQDPALEELPPSPTPTETTLDQPMDNTPTPVTDIVVVRESSDSSSPWVQPSSVSVQAASSLLKKPTDNSKQTPDKENKPKGLGAVTLFGNTEASETGDTMEGFLYDLKQTADRKPSGIERASGGAQPTLKEFVTSGFNPKILKPFFKAPKPLYASQWFFPLMDAKEAPKLFGVEKIVEPKLWVIHYKGKWKAPETMTFRFVGNAGEFLAVNFNNQLVLDACHAFIESSPISNWKPKEHVKEFHVFTKGWPGEFFTFGDWITVEKDKEYPLQILVGERGGGNFCAFLLYQRQGSPLNVDSSKRPKLSVFRTSSSYPPIPNFDKDSEGPPYKN